MTVIGFVFELGVATMIGEVGIREALDFLASIDDRDEILEAWGDGRMAGNAIANATDELVAALAAGAVVRALS